MGAHSAGDAPDGLTDANGDPVPADGHWPAAHYRLHRGRPSLGPGSWRLALGMLAQRDRYPPVTVVAGWLPHGMVSTEPLRETVRRTCPSGWAPHPGFRRWPRTTRPDGASSSGAGRPLTPISPTRSPPRAPSPASTGPWRSRAGATSTAALCSGSNLDLLAGERLDLVICVNPTSSSAGAAGADARRAHGPPAAPGRRTAPAGGGGGGRADRRDRAADRAHRARPRAHGKQHDDPPSPPRRHRERDRDRHRTASPAGARSAAVHPPRGRSGARPEAGRAAAGLAGPPRGGAGPLGRGPAARRRRTIAPRACERPRHLPAARAFASWMFRRATRSAAPPAR